MADDRLRAATVRVTILQYAIVGIFTVLAVGFWMMQVVQHAKFEEMAENNHQRTLALRAPRGIVFDRNQRVLLETFFAKQEGKPLPVLKGLVTTPADGDEPIAPPAPVPAVVRAVR